MIIFLLVVVLGNNPLVLGVDGEYRTATECAEGLKESAKENPAFKGKLRCMKVFVDSI